MKKTISIISKNYKSLTHRSEHWSSVKSETSIAWKKRKFKSTLTDNRDKNKTPTLNYKFQGILLLSKDPTHKPVVHKADKVAQSASSLPSSLKWKEYQWSTPCKWLLKRRNWRSLLKLKKRWSVTLRKRSKQNKSWLKTWLTKKIDFNSDLQSESAVKQCVPHPNFKIKPCPWTSRTMARMTSATITCMCPWCKPQRWITLKQWLRRHLWKNHRLCE